MDSHNSENDAIENKSSGLFALPAAFIKKIYSGSEQANHSTQEQFTRENELVESEEESEFSEVKKSLLGLINKAQKIFNNNESFDSVRKLAYEITDTSGSNHVLIVLTSVLKNLSDSYIIEDKNKLYELPQEILNKFRFSKNYQQRATEINKKCKKIKTIIDLNISLSEIFGLFYDVYQDTYADKEELENFLFNVVAQISNIGDKLNSDVEEYVYDFRVQGSLNERMSNAVALINKKISSGSDLVSLKNSVKEQLDHLQKIVEEERKIVKAQEEKVKNNVKALANRVNELKVETQELRDKVNREKEHALKDPLTGLYNRQAYNNKLIELLYTNESACNKFFLLIWDIDNFKKFNDRYGHVVGDKVLKAVAEKLKNSLKEDYFLARYGGEEFAMLLTNSSMQESYEFADKVREKVSKITFLVKGEKIMITISCGITISQNQDSSQSIFERADKALYEAKNEGRNRVKCYRK